MTYHEIRSLLDHPSASLLRKDQAAFILAFMHSAFKVSGAGQIAEEDLRARLDAWLAERRTVETFEWERPAKEYLEEWCSERCGWLRRTLPGGGLGPVFEITAATEKALTWVETLRGSAFVGTESRMESIFAGMEQLLRETSPDVEERLAILRKQQADLEQEIAEMEQTGRVRVLEPWQVNERFARLMEEARTLLGDFRQVEENFRELAQEVVERQSRPDSTKGEIMGRVLDSHDVVRESPQGRSFYGFVRLLLDPERRERFETQAARVQQLDQLAGELKSNRILTHLMPQLRGEQEKVGDSTQRLTSNLRRALETARLAERRRVRELVSEVQTLALQVKANPPPRDGFFEVEVLPRVWPGASRPFWEAGSAITMLDGLLTGVQEADAAMIGDFQNMPLLSLETLRQNVEACLEVENYVTLGMVLRRFPPEHGLLEVLGYFVLAAQDRERHSIMTSDIDPLHLPDETTWRLPRVLFGRLVFGTPLSPVSGLS
jgi:Protein of unknown function (DUF3375)